VKDGIGYIAVIEWENDDCEYAMLQSAKGGFRIRKVWESDDGAKDLFEGYWNVNVKYGYDLCRKGHGSGMPYGATVWAVLEKDDALPGEGATLPEV